MVSRMQSGRFIFENGEVFRKCLACYELNDDAPRLHMGKCWGSVECVISAVRALHLLYPEVMGKCLVN